MNETEIVLHAMRMESETERDAFLAAECHDHPERLAAVRKVLSLSNEFPENLAEADRAGLSRRIGEMLSAARLSKSAADEPTGIMPPVQEEENLQETVKDEPTPTEGIAIAGRYVLQEKIGEGGMGEVWAAKQIAPVKRRVALKLIKRGMDSDAVLARFEQERQALALMDHPNIAQVLDGGVTDTGQSFFVMELVNGLPLTRFADESKLNTAERLELFIPICHAIQHAHQKGIVHRDLKPANIMVTMIDGRPVPKVIDFGVAKATGGSLSDYSVETQFGAVIGTLEYMSPEQAGYSGVDIDTRADIYSLGVVLYELLTGLRPIDQTRLKEAGLAEMIRVIREDDPSRPSTRLSTSESLPSLAAVRKIDPKKLTALLKGELDWVVMKCLEKNRDRRYDTANGLARDIQRFLSGEVVEARPASASYRFSKFLSRNKGPVVASGLVVAALLAGIAGTTWGMIRANDFAASEKSAREVADDLRIQAVNEKQRAIRFRDQAVAALRAATSEDVEKLLGERQRPTPGERAYLQAIASRWQSFAGQAGTDQQTQRYQAEAHCRVGYLWQKLGRVRDAVDEYQAGRDQWEKLCQSFPDELAYVGELILVRNNLASELMALGRYPEARSELSKAIELGKKLVQDLPDESSHQLRLADSHKFLGVLHAGLGAYDEAIAEYQIAIDIERNRLSKHPSDVECLNNLASTSAKLGVVLNEMGDREAALTAHSEAKSTLLALVAKFPSENTYIESLGRTHNNLGVLLEFMGQRDSALEEYTAARAIRRSLITQFPAVPRYANDLAATLVNLSNLMDATGSSKEAQSSLKEAIEVQKSLVAEFPETIEYRTNLGASCCNYGWSIEASEGAAASLSWFTEAITTLSFALKIDPEATVAKQFLMNGYWGRALSLDKLERWSDAANDWAEVIRLSDPAEESAFRINLAMSDVRAGLMDKALAAIDSMIEQSEHDNGLDYQLARFYAVCSGLRESTQQECIDKAVGLLQKAVLKGLCDVTEIRENPDIAQLKDDDGFRKLLQQLELAAKNNEQQPHTQP